MHTAYIIDAVRTPRGIGRVGKGALAHLHPQDLAVTVLKALAERNSLDTADVDDIIWSTNMQKGKQGGDMGRMAALAAGFDTAASGVTIDRFCGGGISAVSLAAAQIMSGMEDLVIAGGTEMMSYTAALGEKEIQGGIPPLRLGAGNMRLQEMHPQPHQGVSADVIATIEGISREELDRYGVESQARTARAVAEGRFDRSLVPVLNDDGTIALDHDEYPRPHTTLDDLAKLKPSFAAAADARFDIEGNTPRQLVARKFPELAFEAVHHAGTSSGVVDGAAAVLLASDAYAERSGFRPRARILATANAGDDPTLMLNAPVPAARKVLAKAGLTVDDIDLWEINEAFAVVPEKFIRDLSLDRAKVNVNGGAIALGHPIGATGSILIGTLLDELERVGLRRGLITMCAAGGMAPAMIIERV